MRRNAVHVGNPVGVKLTWPLPTALTLSGSPNATVSRTRVPSGRVAYSPRLSSLLNVTGVEAASRVTRTTASSAAVEHRSAGDSVRTDPTAND